MGIRKSAIRRTRRFLSDRALRARVFLLAGTVTNLGYAAFKTVSAALWRAPASLPEAVYYLLLTAARATLFHKERQGAARRGVTLCARLLIALGVTVALLTLRTLRREYHPPLPHAALTVSAVYVGARVLFAARQIRYFTAENRPVPVSAGALSLSASLFSSFALIETLAWRFLREPAATLLALGAGIAATAAVFLLARRVRSEN